MALTAFFKLGMLKEINIDPFELRTTDVILKPANCGPWVAVMVDVDVSVGISVKVAVEGSVGCSVMDGAVVSVGETCVAVGLAAIIAQLESTRVRMSNNPMNKDFSTFSFRIIVLIIPPLSPS